MPGWETTDQYHRFRIREPGDFIEESFRTTDFDGKLPDGVKVIRGKLKETEEWASQSIMFDVDKWTLEEAKSWYSEHKDSVKTKTFVRSAFKMTSPAEWKSIDDENWTIEGYASTDDVDSYRDKILPSAFEKTLPQYMRNPVLMFCHPFSFFSNESKLPIGKVLNAEIRSRGLWIKAQISKTVPKIWTLIKEGMLKAFSIGFNMNEDDTEQDGDVRIIKLLDLIEISVVPVGANPSSLFEMAKAKGIDLKEFFEKEDNHDVKIELSKEGQEKVDKITTKEKEQKMEIDVKLKQDLEDGLKFIHQIKEKVQEIPTKTELKEFEDKVKGDLLKVMDDQAKTRRKIEFEAEMDMNPYVDGSPLNNPAVWLARTPREKFANLLSNTTKNQKVKELQMAADDLLLTHILMRKFNPHYAGIKSLRMFERYSHLSSDFQKALDTATAGEGYEWIPTGFSAELIDKIRLELKVAGLFTQFTMPQSPFVWPLLTGDITPYYMPESLANISEKIPASNITTSNLTFTAKKLAARILCSEEINEDSIVAILPVLKNDMSKGMAWGLEDAVINGDDSATHQDYASGDAAGVSDAKDRRKIFKGLRKLCASGAKYDITTGTTGFTASDLREVRKLMGKYAVNAADCAIIASISAYIQMLGFTETATVDKFGEQATWLKGYLTALDGMPIVVSEYVRQDLNATAVYDASIKTYTIAMIVNKNGYLIGNRRNITVKNASDIETDQEVLVVTQRLDFQPKYVASTEYAVGMGYKITS